MILLCPVQGPWAYSYCIHFVFGPSILIKSLNEINLIEINLQTTYQNLEASLF